MNVPDESVENNEISVGKCLLDNWVEEVSETSQNMTIRYWLFVTMIV